MYVITSPFLVTNRATKRPSLRGTRNRSIRSAQTTNNNHQLGCHPQFIERARGANSSGNPRKWSAIRIAKTTAAALMSDNEGETAATPKRPTEDQAGGGKRLRDRVNFFEKVRVGGTCVVPEITYIFPDLSPFWYRCGLHPDNIPN